MHTWIRSNTLNRFQPMGVMSLVSLTRMGMEYAALTGRASTSCLSTQLQGGEETLSGASSFSSGTDVALNLSKGLQNALSS